MILLEEDEEDWSSSLNAYMIAEGNAILQGYVHDDQEVEDEIKAWANFEAEAKENSVGIWQHGEGAVHQLFNDDDY